MAYGRLDVFWPDGTFKTYLLEEDNVSVGRSTGNTVSLETNTISRYHFSITHNDEHVFITDLESVNGTFVDGVRLPSNNPTSLYGGEEILIGDLRIIYHQLDEMPTQPIASADDTTQRIELKLPDFRIDVVGPDEPFSPGAHMPAEIAITNTSSQSQRYQIEVTGVPPEWVRIDRQELEVAASETGHVLINFKPLRRSDSRPGDYNVTTRIIEKENPDERLEATFPVRILPFSGFGMALETTRLSSGQRFRLHIHNQGSGILPLTISGRDSTDTLRFNILSPQVSLSPGQRAVIQGEVRPKRAAWFGNPRHYPFDLMVRSNDNARFLAAVRGYYFDKPFLPAWTPLVLAIGAGLALLLVAVAALFLFRPAPKPVIADFRVSSTRVAQGSALTVSWAATDATNLSLNVNSTPVVTGIDLGTNFLNLDTTDLAGNVQIELVALNGMSQDSAFQQVFVYPPISVTTFTVSPPQLVRHVVQNLDIQWSVSGAVRTRLGGLDAFSQTPIQPSYGPDGSIKGVVGIANDPFTLTLYAEDESGNVQETKLDVPVANPECQPRTKAITLYAGPDSRQQVVGTVPAGATVVVEAQDSSGRWLRAALPGGGSGWGALSDFKCASTFNVGDLYKELVVPTVPPATSSPPAATRTGAPTQAPATNTPPASAAQSAPSLTVTPSG
jgi:hypothetical protein